MREEGAGRERMGSLPAEGRAGWGWQGARCLERERQGRGNEFPLPVSPAPKRDIPTVQCTAAHRLHPGDGFPPGIASTAPARREGAGEERRRRGRGGGCRQKCMGISLRRRGWCGGAGGVYGYPAGWKCRRRVWQRYPNGAGSHRPASRATGSVPDACASEGDLLRRICEEDVGETYAKQNIARDGFEPSVYGL